MLASTASAEGPGIKLGDRMLLHLGLGVEFRYNDNVFFQDKSTGPAAGFMFLLRPYLELSTRQARDGSANTVDFRLHLGATYTEFISNRDVLSPHRSGSIDAAALMTLFPQSRFNLSLFDNYVRTTQPPYGPEAPTYNLDRDTNQLGVRFQYSPGGHRLTLALSYIFGIDFFENDVFRGFNLFTHALSLYASWRFFPKTALYLSVGETITKYANKDDPNFVQPDSYPLRVELGVMGLITPKLSVNAYIGYGNGFYVYEPAAVAAGKQDPTAGSPNTALGGLNLSWKPSLLSVGNIGYKYDFANALLGAYYQSHQVYINWTQLIWRFTGVVSLRYAYIQYFGVTPNFQIDKLGDTRFDHYIAFDLRLDYPFKPWLIASLGYDMQYDNTNAHLVGTVMMPPPPVAGLVPLNYLTDEVWLRLGVLY
jgi:hypothetical protein